MATFAPDTRPALPESLDHGIAIVGCGGVVEHGHMPAYRRAGFRVAGVASRSAERVKAFAARWGIADATTDWRALVDRRDVEIVDVTYPFDEERIEIVRAAASASKHVLMQKPLAHDLAAAREMVALAERAGVRLAVNQNARWCPQYRAARLAIEAGLLGEVYFAIHEMQNNQDSQPWFQQRWYARQERFQLLEYAVHHLDLLRWWFGQEPRTVKAVVARRPGQVSRGEMIAAVHLVMPNGGVGVVVDDNASDARAPAASRFRVEGTEGLARGEVMARSDFAVRSDRLGPDEHRPALVGSWFPDAFVGTMGELMRAIEQGREPTISGADNLKTLQIVFRAYEDAGA